MDIRRYVENNEDMHYLEQAQALGASRAILRALEKKRDELRKFNEENPQRNDADFKKDFVFISGQINALNWALGLPDQVQRYFETLKTKTKGGAVL